MWVGPVALNEEIAQRISTEQFQANFKTCKKQPETNAQQLEKTLIRLFLLLSLKKVHCNKKKFVFTVY